jgi:threonine dehydrogenase-like Zn-dependent dehydrogenase
MAVGVAQRDVAVPLPVIQDREIRISGSAMYVRDDVLSAIGLMAEGAVPAGDLVTATLPLTEGAQAFKRAAGGDEVKVHLVIHGAGGGRAATSIRSPAHTKAERG